jgi:hypothetical protein
MPDQPRPNFTLLGFAAGTPILTPDGLKRIEDIKPGDVIQTQPDDAQADREPGDNHAPRWWEHN